MDRSRAGVSYCVTLGLGRRVRAAIVEGSLSGSLRAAITHEGEAQRELGYGIDRDLCIYGGGVRATDRHLACARVGEKERLRSAQGAGERAGAAGLRTAAATKYAAATAS